VNENAKRLHSLVKELYKCPSLPNNAERALVLYDIGSAFVVIGSDADRLYLTLGWEITDFSDGDTIYSYMVVSTKGVRILRYLRLPIETHRAEKHCLPYDLSIADTQQTLDYLRLLVKQETFSYPLINLQTTIEDVGFIREIRLTSLVISTRSISVCIDNMEQIELVKEHEWNFNHIGSTLLSYLSDTIREQSPYMEDFILTKAQALKRQRVQNTSLYELFLHKKRALSPEIIVVIQVDQNYLTFDDDAINITDTLKNALLYECNVFGLRGRTAVLLSCSQLNALKADNKLSVVNSPVSFPLYEIGLKESFLNQKCNHELAYSDVAIRKRKDGNYVLSASYNKNKLPEMPILNAIGGYYSNLPPCKERNAILSTLVHHAYDDMISAAF
jgi:hypothetical protein